MKYDLGINVKALVFGAAIAAAFILFGYQYNDWLYPFSAIGLIYAGYGQNDLKMGTLMGLFASTPIVVLTLQGYMGSFDGFFLTETGIMTVTLIILIVGAVVGFVGAWTKRSRVKALEQYEKQQKIGKNKNKKKKAKVQPQEEKTFVDKIFKK
ncbi:MAG: hypothetical protein UIB31_07375 [Methanobrevibacter sp.]|uniref:hypothetical protein n=1 Tax=Methanobrevibacter sp. TaxID=66852 RepID=UPI001E114BD5|nr:hypothetical protein [Methanobrevibacter sp.]MBE6489858.1 hypothetical protein [Methanobrevibacter sp.]MEE0902334.1 hypothetical protein [Methanobrevibacter sp.]MEE0935953.1 hypothetical protein [Methanobrevibacter sp.]